MCGIFGTVSFHGGGTTFSAEELREVLRHRGPDDFGTVSLPGPPRVLLAHNRLRVIDLSAAGRQPMFNEDGSVALVFNGEIYNFKDLRSELAARGHRFVSQTDTETLVHLYEERGPDLLQKINGMFAFGLWDSRQERLILARDRLGVKPLVYSLAGGQCVFASEIKALLRYPGVRRELDWRALELFFTFNYIPAPWTIYKGIRKLLPGHYLLWDRSGARVLRYWDLDPDVFPLPARLEEICARLREAVGEATRVRMYSDVPMGAFLSGGIDSSIVVANMAQNSSRRVRTFFVGYKNEKMFDETPYARALAERYGTEHCEIFVSPEEVYRVIPEVLSFFDEPFADSSALPSYIVSRETRKHVTVALSGDGGDEIFGGYRRYWAEVYRRCLSLLSPSIRDKALFPLLSRLPDSKGSPLYEAFRRLKIFCAGCDRLPAERHYKWMCYFPDPDREALFTRAARAEFDGTGRRYLSSFFRGKGRDTINAALYADVKNLLPFDMLTKVDWMSMANSLEVRSPLLDFRVAELAFQVPGRYKVKPTRLKYILRHAFRDLLPPSIQRRGKRGFEVPIGEWLKRNRALQELFWEKVNAPAVREMGLFLPEKIRSLYGEHAANRRDHTHKLWAIFVFAWWLQGDYGIG